jgi:hypothetical protein
LDLVCIITDSHIILNNLNLIHQKKKILIFFEKKSQKLCHKMALSDMCI